MNREEMVQMTKDYGFVFCPKCGEGWSKLTPFVQFIDGENKEVCYTCREKVLEEHKLKQKELANQPDEAKALANKIKQNKNVWG